MFAVAKKRAKRDAHKGKQTPFRAQDPRLLDALDRYARGIRRSRNMALNLILEEFLQGKGLWPPGAPPAS